MEMFKLKGILKNLDEDLRLNAIVNQVKKKTTRISVCRFYISEKLEEIQGSFLWHHDALFDYYKILVYLTPVNEEDGPFEYIPKSNQKEWKFYSFKRSRFNEKYLENEKKIKFIGQPGDVIILNANGIHRACNPSSNRKRIVASKAFIDFISEESTDHTIAKSRILKLPNPYVV